MLKEESSNSEVYMSSYSQAVTALYIQKPIFNRQGYANAPGRAWYVCSKILFPTERSQSIPITPILVRIDVK